MKNWGIRLFAAMWSLISFACQQELPKEIAVAYEGLPEQVDFNYHVNPSSPTAALLATAPTTTPAKRVCG